MKKFFLTILAFVYLATSSGAVLTMHYCMGELYSVNFSQENKCDKCGMKHKKDCCEQKSKIIRAQDNHEASVQAFVLQAPAALLHSDYNALSHLAFLSGGAPRLLRNNSPPPNLSSPSFCILHCVFRI